MVYSGKHCQLCGQMKRSRLLWEGSTPVDIVLYRLLSAFIVQCAQCLCGLLILNKGKLRGKDGFSKISYRKGIRYCANTYWLPDDR